MIKEKILEKTGYYSFVAKEGEQYYCLICGRKIKKGERVYKYLGHYFCSTECLKNFKILNKEDEQMRLNIDN